MNLFALIANPSKADRLLKALVLVPNLFPAIQLAEQRYPGHGRGPEKKVFVLASIDFLTDALQRRGYIPAEMTAGLEKIAGELVDVIVEFMNMSEIRGAPDPASEGWDDSK